MVGARTAWFIGVPLALCTWGCGARSGLLTDADEQTPGGASGASAGGASAGGAGTSAGGASAGASPAVAGAGGAPSPPVSTNCQLQGNDPRVAGIQPDQIASLDGRDFVTGDVKSYHWSVQREDCDAIVPDAQFKLDGVDSRVVKFQPSRPAFYHFTLEVTGFAGDRSSCKLEVPVQGVGMRVELCWDTSTTTDLDLYVHTPFNREPWFAPFHSIVLGLNDTTCNTSNAVPTLRSLSRVNWGYADSPLSACNTPSFEDFLGIGRCPNPRAADDNNQSIATGTTERMQLDNPRRGQTFRVMVQNFSNRPAQPRVFVYCGGQRAGAFDTPANPRGFMAAGVSGYGVMWRAADVTTSVDEAGTTSCVAQPVVGRALTFDDATF